AVEVDGLNAGIAQVTFAADMAPPPPPPPPAPYKAPPPVYFYSWTGCYVGGNGGGLWVTKDYDLSGAAIAGLGAVVVPGITMGGHDASGGMGGGQVGCNYQVGGWVFGIQGDYDWTKANGSHADPFGGGTILTSSTKSLASATARVGY